MPILDASVLLNFAVAREGDVEVTPEGRAFAEADIPTRRSLFRDAVLVNVPLLRQMHTALEKKTDRRMPVDFFRDLLDEHFSDDEVRQQVETAIGWGRYGELFVYDSGTDTIHLEFEGDHAHPSESARLHE